MMLTVDRLICPFCRTQLPPGVFVCPRCGAARRQRRPSLLLIAVVFPLLALAISVVGAPVAADLPETDLIAWFWLAFWVAFVAFHLTFRLRTRWERGVPVAPLAIAYAMPADMTPEAEPASVGDKTCPRCAETVKRAARVCRFCGFNFQGQAESEPKTIDITPTRVTTR